MNEKEREKFEKDHDDIIELKILVRELCSSMKEITDSLKEARKEKQERIKWFIGGVILPVILIPLGAFFK